jgi:hypothetical protein
MVSDRGNNEETFVLIPYSSYWPRYVQAYSLFKPLAQPVITIVALIHRARCINNRSSLWNIVHRALTGSWRQKKSAIRISYPMKCWLRLYACLIRVMSCHVMSRHVMSCPSPMSLQWPINKCCTKLLVIGLYWCERRQYFAIVVPLAAYWNSVCFRERFKSCRPVFPRFEHCVPVSGCVCCRHTSSPSYIRICERIGDYCG